jgi:hypothetical protein
LGRTAIVIATPGLWDPGGSNSGERSAPTFSGLLRRCAPRNDESIRTPRALEAQRMRSWKADKALGSQPGTRVGLGKNFFIWIRCNPLKSPDSAKENQGNASFFPWGLSYTHTPSRHVFCGQKLTAAPERSSMRQGRTDFVFRLTSGRPISLNSYRGWRPIA